jgi:putative alpha-1,2-mannosidase
MPDARIAGSNGMTQGGSNGDVLIADAIVKGVKGIDYETAYQALVKNAETDSPDPLDYGREEMSLYRVLGFLPLGKERSGSRTMEYSYDDFAISQVAQALGKTDAVLEYRRRSRFWSNLWDKDMLSVHPRYPDGRWMTPFDRGLTTKSWQSPFYEGSPWQYSTYVPHDVQGLIN